MFSPAAKRITQYPWLSAAGINAILIGLFLCFATPLLNSGDDAYLLYTLGGGYGEKPTALLHYNHIWHPVLGTVVSGLFKAVPGINWYTLLLLFFHVAGCCCMLYVLLKQTKPALAIPAFFLLFLFTETRQLLSLTFTGAAFTAALGATTLLMHSFQSLRNNRKNCIAGVLLLILAGLLRLQVALLVILLVAAIALAWLRKKQLLYWSMAVIAAVIVLWGFNKQHERYYKKHIPDWEKQEKFRQALFYSYNRQLVSTIPPGVFADSTEQALFFSAYLYDTGRFTTSHIQSISKNITRNRSIFNAEDRVGLYWFFVEMRVYLILLAGLAGLLLVSNSAATLLRFLPPVLAFLAVHGYLFLYLKITMPLHIGLLMFLLLALMLCFAADMTLFSFQPPTRLVPLLVIIFSAIWICIRLNKENDVNKDRNRQFLCALKELGENKDQLLIATDDDFPLGYCSIWYTPARYPAGNLLYKDRLITFSYKKTLERFHINDLEKAIVNNPAVYFTGRKLPALEKYYGDTLLLSGPLQGSSCITRWKLSKRQ